MRPMLGKTGNSGPWPWWCCGPAIKKTRRIYRKIEKRMWRKEEDRANA